MMGAKGLWRHILGNVIVLVLYAISNGVPMLADEKMPANEDQIGVKNNWVQEERIHGSSYHDVYNFHTSWIKQALKTAKDMWKAVVEDAMSKSTLYLLDAKD